MKFTQSLVAIAALSTLSFAGGDINPVTVFEQEPVVVPVEPVVVPKAVVKAPPPPPPAPKPKPVAKPLGVYVAGGLTNIAVSTDGSANLFSEQVGQDRQVGFTGKIGYDFMDYLGAELRGTYGLSKQTNNKFQQIGAYLKPNYNITDEFNLYGLLGASRANLNDTALSTATDTGLSYGIGVDYDVTDSISVFTDALNYLNKTDSTNQWGLTLGAAYNF